MKKRIAFTISFIAGLIIALIVIFVRESRQNQFANKEFHILYPFHNALFPPEFPPPTIKWRDTDNNIKNNINHDKTC